MKDKITSRFKGKVVDPDPGLLGQIRIENI
jgi:hypothetical protein